MRLRWFIRKTSNLLGPVMPEILMVAGLAALTVTAWVWNGYAGGIMLGVSLGFLAWATNKERSG